MRGLEAFPRWCCLRAKTQVSCVQFQPRAKRGHTSKHLLADDAPRCTLVCSRRRRHAAPILELSNSFWAAEAVLEPTPGGARPPQAPEGLATPARRRCAEQRGSHHRAETAAAPSADASRRLQQGKSAPEVAEVQAAAAEPAAHRFRQLYRGLAEAERARRQQTGRPICTRRAAFPRQERETAFPKAARVVPASQLRPAFPLCFHAAAHARCAWRRAACAMGESTAPPVWSTEGRAIALRRPARKQMDGPAPQERDRGAGGGEFNVWCARAARCEPRGVWRSACRQCRCEAALMRSAAQVWQVSDQPGEPRRAGVRHCAPAPWRSRPPARRSRAALTLTPNCRPCSAKILRHDRCTSFVDSGRTRANDWVRAAPRLAPRLV